MNEIIVSGRIKGQFGVYKNDNDEITHIRFSLARSRQRGEEWISEYYTVVCFPPLTDAVSKHLVQNDRIVVFGRLSQNVFTDQEGTVVRHTNIVARDILVSVSELDKFFEQSPGEGPVDEEAEQVEA
jgi:single-stranded DNA-binding protein